jgi:hypothetical protein
MNQRYIFFIASTLVLFGMIARFIPHAPNMTPITAIAFVGGVYLGKRWSLILPCLALFLSDIVIGFYDWKIMLSVYGSFILIGFLSWIVRKYPIILPFGVSVISASFLFFLITNGAVWAFSPWYEKSLSGLLYSYELGIPFWRNMLIGDVIYTAVLVSVFEVAYASGALKRPLLKSYQSSLALTP